MQEEQNQETRAIWDHSFDILLIEDEDSHAELIQRAFEDRGGHVHVYRANSLSEARSYLASNTPTLIIADWRLSDGESLALLPDRNDPLATPVILMISYGNERIAVEALKSGALDYVVKSPESMMDMPHLAERAIEQWNVRAEHIRMQQALKESESQFRLLAENASDMISRHTTEGIFIYVSPACKTMIGFSPEELIGKSSLDFIHPEDRSNFKSLFSKNPSMPTVYTFAYQARHKDGQYVWLETSARSILDEKTGSVIEIQAASRDITARKEADEKIRRLNIGLEQLAMTDYLTNLYNRRYFMQRGAEEFKRSRRNNQPLALLMLDIDQFKKVNDTYGHETGDLALQQVAAALKSSLREIDILGRMGGEEFAVLLPNTLLHAAALLAERVQQTMAGTSFEMLGVSSTISITISIGVAAATNEMSGIDDMLRNADAAMYQAKHYGGNRVMQYEDVSGAHQGPSVPASE